MKRSLLIFSSYPTPLQAKDGYFQRVLEIDRIFCDYRRIYVTFEESGGFFPRRRVLDASTSSLNVDPRNLFQWAVLGAVAFLRGRIYVHSVLNLSRKGARWMLRIPRVRTVLDIHGAVPEEFLYNDDPILAARFNSVEVGVLPLIGRLIAVTRAMADHMHDKYERLPKTILLPIISTFADSVHEKAYDPARVTAIYAGGTQKWQQMDLMMDAVYQSDAEVEILLFVPDPIFVEKMAADRGIPADRIFTASVPKHELVPHYRRAHFGFILREDIVVNRVACPTKLIEYLQFGIVPVMNDPRIGDFMKLGLRYLALEDFVMGKFPDKDEYRSMQFANRALLERLKNVSNEGQAELRHYFS